MSSYTLQLKRLSFLVVSSLILTNCGGGGGATTSSSSTTTTTSTTTNSTSTDEFSQTSYKGLEFYSKVMPSSKYKLEPLTDGEFNALSSDDKLLVANKLLNSLFFGYPLATLKEKIDSGTFISDIRESLNSTKTDRAYLEEHLLDSDYFYQYTYGEEQAVLILTRFYEMKNLDKYFINNWIAYILTQTIMFSPAYELSSSHSPDISRVYNRIVNMLENGNGMRFIAYVHMMSEDNWRRFRSPEDNGREMLEIFLFDTDDTHVPLAGKALQNWKLNRDNDTLEIGLNQNTEPIKLFGTTIYNGDDFYRELAKSDDFTKGVTTRLVDFFFPEDTQSQKDDIVKKIVSSKPEAWQDILFQIIFSKEYLLNNHRTQSAEETFFSLAKKLHFKHHRSTFSYLKTALENMHQATMKYKLGRLERVPEDTLSISYYTQYIRNEILLRYSSVDDNYDSWSRQGWSDDFLSFDNFDYDTTDDVRSLASLVNYIFNTVVARDALADEQAMFKEHMIEDRDGKELFKYEFNMFVTYDDEEKTIRKQEEYKRNIATVVFEYLSRVDMTYRQREVK